MMSHPQCWPQQNPALDTGAYVTQKRKYWWSNVTITKLKLAHFTANVKLYPLLNTTLWKMN